MNGIKSMNQYSNKTQSILDQTTIWENVGIICTIYRISDKFFLEEANPTDENFPGCLDNYEIVIPDIIRKEFLRLLGSSNYVRNLELSVNITEIDGSFTVTYTA